MFPSSGQACNCGPALARGTFRDWVHTSPPAVCVNVPFLSPFLQLDPALAGRSFWVPSLTKGFLSDWVHASTPVIHHRGSLPVPSLQLLSHSAWGVLLGTSFDRGVLFGTGFRFFDCYSPSMFPSSDQACNFGPTLVEASFLVPAMEEGHILGLASVLALLGCVLQWWVS